jgi:uncharacterized protein DUF3425
MMMATLPQSPPISTSLKDNGSRQAPRASEKRKAQNRAAQKTYREKRKRRLQELEQLAASAGLISGSTSSGSTSQSPPETTSPLESPLDILPTSSSVLDLPVVSTDSETPDFDAISLFPTNDFLSQSLDLTASTDSIWQAPPINASQDSAWLAAVNGLSSFVDIAEPLPFTNSNVSRAPHLSAPTSKAVTLKRSAYKDRPRPKNLEEFEALILADMQKQRSKLADPYSNTLRLHQTTLCWAFYQNVLHIGMDESICDEDKLSPFYRPDIASALAISSSNNDAVVRSVQSTFACLKRDLRPTKEQITMPHPGYIDALPWPDVRSRIIELLAHDPPLFDEEQFWTDIENDGLRCWGSVAVRPGQQTMGSGAPWDARSWEAKTWFLAKWSFVVGGEEGELSRSSLWWREMRGVGQGWGF